jgi:hypothetical protein
MPSRFIVSCTALAEGATRHPSCSSCASVNHVRLVGLDRGAKGLAVEHREDLEGVCHLHGRRILVTVAGDDPAAEPLGGDCEFPAELAGTQEHQSGDMHRRAIAARTIVG